MKKKSLTLWIMLGVVLVLTALTVLVTVLGAGDQPGEGSQTDASTYLFIADRDSADIRKIDYIYEGSESVSLIKTDRWRLVKDENFPVSQEKINSLASAMSTVAVQRTVVESATDYGQYGLASPKTQITVTYQDGGQMTFYLGNENTRLEGTHYLKTSESDAVYLVSSTMITFFAYQWNEILELDTIPEIEAADMNEILIENPRATGIKLSRTEAAGPGETSTAWEATYGDGTTKLLDSANLAGDLLAGVMSLTLTDPVCCAPMTDELKAQYGVDADHATKVTLKYTVTTSSSVGDSSSSATTKVEKTLVLWFGADAGDGQESQTRYTYVMMDDSSYVYRCLINEAAELLVDFAPEESEETAE